MGVSGVITPGRTAGEVSKPERRKLANNIFSGSKREMNVVSMGSREDAGVSVVSSTMSKESHQAETH